MEQGESSCTIAHLLFVISLDNLSRFPVIAQKSQLGRAAGGGGGGGEGGRGGKLVAQAG